MAVLTTFFTVVFLPHGFPDSVSKDYIPYQIWDSIQAFASSITGSICTHAILKGAGVGDETASPLAATITWLIKDGTSMIGRICFAWLQGTKLDSDCKKWRLFADVLNDIAMFLDLVSAYFQNHFTLIVCISGLCKSLVGVAGGSTRAALTQHQARKNNMADVSAKDGSQETLVNLLALICSLFIVPIVAESFLLTWILYISMTIVHLTANYFAVKSVVMEIFNISRFKIYTRHYLSEGSASQDFLSVAEVNQKESLCPSFRPKRVTVILGSSFKDAIQRKRWKDIKELLEIYKTTDYILCVSKTSISKC
ncbi:RUS family member 1-like isoform X2 [Stegodyphus dumicola]|uniref:RUS family member 1-like isoform X2 n=1 Tax=Stegodyphus dumicola TaxID=202533 RepID=UPI0015AEA475|nr:RUS family member 1-like isoform X2 [Stegodyphus dumicola]